MPTPSKALSPTRAKKNKRPLRWGKGESERTRGAVAKSSASRCKGPLKIAATDGNRTTSGCTTQTSDATKDERVGGQKDGAKFAKQQVQGVRLALG